MNANICQPQHADSYLHGGFSQLQEEEYLRHLDDCENCREYLESIAADSDIWAEVREFLTSQPDTGDNTVAALAGHSVLPLQVQQIVQSLGPTDDPHAMGRIENFEITGVVGSGAMGVVLKARDTSLDRVVALKIMNPGLAASGTARSRFEREAKAAAAVHHPNVVAIHGVRTSTDLPYLVMPYLKGSTLQQRIEEQGPLGLPEILRVGSQIAAGLAAAHRQGVVHRDIKPSNILLDEGVEAAIITDFGLARIVDDATMTRTGVISGTPEFMSPEQARGDAIDEKSDLFSLGSLLYMLCTGYPPFRAHTSFGVLRRITDETPKPIRQLNAEIPTWLCTVIEDMHRKSPAERPTALETQATLEACLAHVYQPDQVPLPEECHRPQTEPSVTFPLRYVYMGAFAMTVAAIFLGLFLLYEGDKSRANSSLAVTPSTVVEPGGEESGVYKIFTVNLPNPEKRGMLVVDIERGFVDVDTHDKPQVVIEVLYPNKMSETVPAGTLKQQFSPAFDLDVDEDVNRIKLDTYNQDFRLNLRVKVPKEIDLDLETYRDGYLKVSGVNGTIITRTQHSDISLLDIAGSAQAYSYNGDFEIRFRKLSESAKLDFETYNGSIDLSLPKKANVTTAISAGRGTYGSEFEIVPAVGLSMSDKRGRQLSASEYSIGTINEGGIPLRLECAKGRISIRKSSLQNTTER